MDPLRNSVLAVQLRVLKTADIDAAGKGNDRADLPSLQEQVTARAGQPGRHRGAGPPHQECQCSTLSVCRLFTLLRWHALQERVLDNEDDIKYWDHREAAWALVYGLLKTLMSPVRALHHRPGAHVRRRQKS